MFIILLHPVVRVGNMADPHRGRFCGFCCKSTTVAPRGPNKSMYCSRNLRFSFVKVRSASALYSDKRNSSTVSAGPARSSCAFSRELVDGCHLNIPGPRPSLHWARNTNHKEILNRNNAMLMGVKQRTGYAAKILHVRVDAQAVKSLTHHWETKHLRAQLEWLHWPFAASKTNVAKKMQMRQAWQKPDELPSG